MTVKGVEIEAINKDGVRKSLEMQVNVLKINE
jgi:hypothetical protein